MIPPVAPFFISGEAGRKLSAQRVSFEALGIQSANITYRSMAADVLTWVQKRPSSGEWLVPEDGQQISVFDRTGRRIFVGRTKRRFSYRNGLIDGYAVTAYGPFNWLEKADLLGPVTDATGQTVIRPYAVFPTQPIGMTIREVIALAIGQGAPFVLGEVPDWFEFTRTTCSKVKYAKALADIMSPIPDVATRIRYDVDGPPVLDIIRRKDAEIITLNLKVEDRDGVTELDMEANEDLRPTSVSVQSVARDPVTQKAVFVTETVGEETGPAFRKQTVVASGPENSATVPTDVYESDTVQTAAAVVWSWVKATDPQIAAAIANYGDVTLSAATGATYGAQSGSGGTIKYYTDIPPRIYDSNGNVLIGSYRLVTGEIPEWVTKDYGIQKVEAFLRGQFGGYLFNDGPFGYDDLEDYSPTLDALKDEGRFPLLTGYNPGGPYTDIRYHGWITVDLPITVINVDYPAPETLWRKQDYDFLYPPSGLARNLYDAQNWTPWVGRGSLDKTARRLPAPGTLLNVLGGEEDLATARAAVQSLSIELRNGGGASFVLGTPPIMDALSLMDRVRRSASDNYTVA